MSERIPKLLLEDIIESAEKIIDYTHGQSYEDFITDSKTVDAVIRNFEIIGEAANRLSDTIRDGNTEIDWFKIRGMRNRVVHHYFGINYEIIWSTKEDYLPHLISQIKNMIETIIK